MDALTMLVQAHMPAAARGDREAFGRLVDATRTLVSSIALAIVRDADLSRDVAQDVFLTAWRDLSQLRDPNSFLPWLRQMTRHRAYHVLRTDRRRARRITHAEADALLESAADPGPGADARLLANEERQAVATVLDELPDETREVVTLFYREGQSSAQVAALLGLSEPAVRKRLSRARASLRASLLEHFGDSVRRSAPGAGWTSAVLTAIAVGAPAQASAATAAGVKLGGAATAASFASKALAFAGAVALPAAGGLAGVFFGTRQMKRQARSATELRELRQFELASATLVVATAIAFPAGWLLTESDWSPVATFTLFIAGLAALHALWLPRILAPRFALEMAEDPEAARAARARERRAARIGWTAGLTMGTAGLLLGIWL